MKSKKWLWVLLFFLVAAGGGGTYWWLGQAEEAKASLDIVTVTRGPIEDVVTAQGTLEPKDYVDVGAQVSGQIKKLYVDIGDTVKAGDLLAELDPQVYATVLKGDEAKLGSLQAQLEQQKAQTEYDQLQFARAEKLVKTGAVSREDFETKDKALKVAQATIKSLEAQIAEVQASVDKDKVNLGYTKIYAPMDGIVSDRTAREGQTLNANQTTPTILQIANLGVMTIRAEIAEADVMRLKPDMAVTFTTMGSDDRKWTAKIRQLLPTPEVVNDVVLYNALIDVENPDGQLMNGMSAQVSFVVAKIDDTLRLPTRALGMRVTDQDTAESKAYRVRVVGARDQEEERTVKVGLMTRSHVQVLQGLEEGDQVLVGSSTDDKKKTTNKPMGPPGMGPRL